jgi:hypothetical protein
METPSDLVILLAITNNITKNITKKESRTLAPPPHTMPEGFGQGERR